MSSVFCWVSPTRLGILSSEGQERRPCHSTDAVLSQQRFDAVFTSPLQTGSDSGAEGDEPGSAHAASTEARLLEERTGGSP